jgi:hypothetical protein
MLYIVPMQNGTEKGTETMNRNSLLTITATNGTFGTYTARYHNTLGGFQRVANEMAAWLQMGSHRFSLVDDSTFLFTDKASGRTETVKVAA